MRRVSGEAAVLINDELVLLYDMNKMLRFMLAAGIILQSGIPDGLLFFLGWHFASVAPRVLIGIIFSDSVASSASLFADTSICSQSDLLAV